MASTWCILNFVWGRLRTRSWNRWNMWRIRNSKSGIFKITEKKVVEGVSQKCQVFLSFITKVCISFFSEVEDILCLNVGVWWALCHFDCAIFFVSASTNTIFILPCNISKVDQLMISNSLTNCSPELNSPTCRVGWQMKDIATRLSCASSLTMHVPPQWCSFSGLLKELSFTQDSYFISVFAWAFVYF